MVMLSRNSFKRGLFFCNNSLLRKFSHDAPKFSENHINFTQELLKASLPYVQTLGWSKAAMAQGAKDLGLSPLTIGMCINGEADLVYYFLEEKRSFVKKSMASIPNLDSSNRNVVLSQALSLHLDILEPYVSSWPSGIATLANPMLTWKNIRSLMDDLEDLCDFANIKCTRMDWYSERILLGFLYLSTNCYMITDSSPALSDTREFLLRNVDQYSRTHAYFSSLANGDQHLKSLMTSLFSSFTSPSATSSGSSPVSWVWSIIQDNFVGSIRTPSSSSAHTSDSMNTGPSNDKSQPETAPTSGADRPGEDTSNSTMNSSTSNSL